MRPHLPDLAPLPHKRVYDYIVGANVRRFFAHFLNVHSTPFMAVAVKEIYIAFYCYAYLVNYFE